MIKTIIVAVATLMLCGCSHSQWASVELATQGASWLNPVATVVHMTASAGRALTEPHAESQEKVQQREEDRRKESSPVLSQPGPSRTETK